jgi:hypothetical protein
LDDLETFGFGTVQVVWASNWWAGAKDQEEGYGKLACRPASVIEWIYTNLHPAPSQPFCATGHSNGASQIGYVLAQYGMSDILDHVLFESGPNYSRVDHACISDPAYAQLYFTSNAGRDLVDWSFGLNGSGTGPCLNNNPAYLSKFEEASLSLGASWEYVYPTTNVSFIFGGDDGGSTAAHGIFHHDTVVASGSPYVSMEVIAGAGHDVGDYDPLGTYAIKETLLDECSMMEFFIGDKEPGSARRWPGASRR